MYKKGESFDGVCQTNGSSGKMSFLPTIDSSDQTIKIYLEFILFYFWLK